MFTSTCTLLKIQSPQQRIGQSSNYFRNINDVSYNMAKVMKILQIVFVKAGLCPSIRIWHPLLKCWCAFSFHRPILCWGDCMYHVLTYPFFTKSSTFFRFNIEPRHQKISDSSLKLFEPRIINWRILKVSSIWNLRINVKFYLLLPGAGALIFSPTKHSLNKPRVLPK